MNNNNQYFGKPLTEPPARVNMEPSLSDLLALGSEEKNPRNKENQFVYQTKENNSSLSFGVQNLENRDENEKTFENNVESKAPPMEATNTNEQNKEKAGHLAKGNLKLHEGAASEQEMPFLSREEENSPSPEEIENVELRFRIKASEIVRAYHKDQKRPFPGSCYSLLEDLTISSRVEQNENYQKWKSLGDHIFLASRSMNSLRDRCRKYLWKLSKIDLLRILRFIERYSESRDFRCFCLVFEKKNNETIFKEIQEISRQKRDNRSVVMKSEFSHTTERSPISVDDGFDFEEERAQIGSDEGSVRVVQKNDQPSFSTNIQKATLQNQQIAKEREIAQKNGIGKDLANHDMQPKNGNNEPKTKERGQAFTNHDSRIHCKQEIIDLSSLSAQNMQFTPSQKTPSDVKNRIRQSESLSLKRRESPVLLSQRIQQKYKFCPHLLEIFDKSLFSDVSEKFGDLSDKVLEEVDFTNLMVLLKEGANPKEKTVIKIHQAFNGSELPLLLEMGQKYQKTLPELLRLLDSMCGNVKDLESYLAGKEKHTKMLWYEEEDKILEGVKSKESLEFRILLRYKEIEKIKTRVKYKEFHLPFEL